MVGGGGTFWRPLYDVVKVDPTRYKLSKGPSHAQACKLHVSKPRNLYVRPDYFIPKSSLQQIVFGFYLPL